MEQNLTSNQNGKTLFIREMGICDQCMTTSDFIETEGRGWRGPCNPAYLRRGLLTLFFVGLILIPYFIYLRHKGQKLSRKKIILWDFIFFLFMVTLQLVVRFAFWEPIVLN